MRFLLGVILGVVAVLVAGYFVGMSGAVSVAATQHGGMNDVMDTWLARSGEHSILKHSPDKKNPFGNDPAAVAVGLAHYKENCLDCHGAKSIDTEEFAKGLNPAAPMLDMDAFQKMTDGQLFWVVSNGIRMTGMPAFSPTHSEEEIWKIVSFVRHLPKLTDAEIAQLKKGREDSEEHHKAGAESSEHYEGAEPPH